MATTVNYSQSTGRAHWIICNTGCYIQQDVYKQALGLMQWLSNICLVHLYTEIMTLNFSMSPNLSSSLRATGLNYILLLQFLFCILELRKQQQRSYNQKAFPSYTNSEYQTGCRRKRMLCRGSVHGGLHESRGQSEVISTDSRMRNL